MPSTPALIIISIFIVAIVIGLTAFVQSRKIQMRRQLQRRVEHDRPSRQTPPRRGTRLGLPPRYQTYQEPPPTYDAVLLSEEGRGPSTGSSSETPIHLTTGDAPSAPEMALLHSDTIHGPTTHEQDKRRAGKGLLSQLLSSTRLGRKG
ncbi:hypothetical protein K431DRAFT_128409 [Polychaeton citri CBS 116435]|uniref:Uncharacterized protein n=1 Tax=Polychaeton citri CBS 116435 TaxID=1314669 RepID=A0A9P4UMQ8_9PEZI|nr:hypothetical protein K431DRAFT_128409 [Polychaeton citri CBS 116435]